MTLYDGFKVDRVGLKLLLILLQQSKEKQAIHSTSTWDGFTGSQPMISFFDRFGENPDIVVNDVTVLDSENLYGRMTLSNPLPWVNAMCKSLRVTTVFDS